MITHLFELFLSYRVKVFVDDNATVDHVEFKFESVKYFDAAAFLLADQRSDDLGGFPFLSSLSRPMLGDVHDDEGMDRHAHASLKDVATWEGSVVSSNSRSVGR